MQYREQVSDDFGAIDVLGFYGHSDGKEYKEFSNFYIPENPEKYTFIFPEFDYTIDG